MGSLKNDDKCSYRNVVHMRISPDYLRDKRQSNILAKRIQDYWNLKGYTWVKAWTETTVGVDGSKQFSVRSNMVFKVPR